MSHHRHHADAANHHLDFDSPQMAELAELEGEVLIGFVDTAGSVRRSASAMRGSRLVACSTSARALAWVPVPWRSGSVRARSSRWVGHDAGGVPLPAARLGLVEERARVTTPPIPAGSGRLAGGVLGVDGLLRHVATWRRPVAVDPWRHCWNRGTARPRRAGTGLHVPRRDVERRPRDLGSGGRRGVVGGGSQGCADLPNARKMDDHYPAMLPAPLRGRGGRRAHRRSSPRHWTIGPVASRIDTSCERENCSDARPTGRTWMRSTC